MSCRFLFQPGQAVKANLPMGHGLQSSYNSQLGVIQRQVPQQRSLSKNGETYPCYQVRFVTGSVAGDFIVISEEYLETSPEIDLLVATRGGL